MYRKNRWAIYNSLFNSISNPISISIQFNNPGPHPAIFFPPPTPSPSASGAKSDCVRGQVWCWFQCWLDTDSLILVITVTKPLYISSFSVWPMNQLVLWKSSGSLKTDWFSENCPDFTFWIGFTLQFGLFNESYSRHDQSRSNRVRPLVRSNSYILISSILFYHFDHY